MANRTVHRKKHRISPRISRAKLTTLHHELDVTHDVLTDAFHKFWIIPDGDIRQTLAATQKKIGKAVAMLRRAA